VLRHALCLLDHDRFDGEDHAGAEDESLIGWVLEWAEVQAWRFVEAAADAWPL